MSKKIVLYANNNPESIEIKERLSKLIAPTTLSLAQAYETPDYIISIGGDGTLLSAFHEYQEHLDHVLFIGIHTGHLGFYTDWLPHELELLVTGLEHSDHQSVSYPLLEVTVKTKDGLEENFIALNEFSIRAIEGTLVLDVYIKDYFFETFRGDGMCIATPTGSTGHNKSLGGAIIHPRVEALQLTEIAGINNRVYRTIKSPMIVPRDEWIRLQPINTNASVVLQLDHRYIKKSQIEEVRASIASSCIQFAQLRHTHFWDRVENAFLGNKSHHHRRELKPKEDA